MFLLTPFQDKYITKTLIQTYNVLEDERGKKIPSRVLWCNKTNTPVVQNFQAKSISHQMCSMKD